MASFDDDLRLAHVLADSVERPTLAAFGAAEKGVRVRDDGSVAVPAGVQAEQLLRGQLQRTRPRDVVQGQELPTTGHGSRCWVLDPIDGTAAFVRGVPVWGTLIALLVDGAPVLGLVSAPALGRRWWAAQGSGAWTGRALSRARRIGVSRTETLEHALASCSPLGTWLRHPRREGLLRLADRCWSTRSYGDFWAHALVAEGAVDLAVACTSALPDVAALHPIVTEAGGRLGDLDGSDGPFGTSALSTNGLLHDAALSLLDAGVVAQ